jgi:hypothetical protein
VKKEKDSPVVPDPLVAAHLAGVIYQARLYNRQARMSIPEKEVVSEVLELWKTVMERMGPGEPAASE